MLAKHLEGDTAISKEEVKQAISNGLDKAATDAVESKQNVDGAKIIMEAANVEVKDLAQKGGIRITLIAPDGTVLAASEIGFLSAAAPNFRFLDIAGLNDNRIALNGFSADYVLKRKPEIIWFPPSDSTGVIYKFLSDDRFFGEYSYFPEAFNYGLAINKSSPFAGQIMKKLEEYWQKTYPCTNLYDYAGFRLTQ